MRKSFVEFLPIYAFTFVWLLTIFLYYLNPFNLPAIKTYTWFVVLTGIAMIYIGFFSGKFLTQGFSFQIKAEIPNRKDFPFPIAPIKKILFIFTTISLIGIVAKYILIIQAIGGIRNFLVDPGFTRRFVTLIELGQGPVNPMLFKMFSYSGSFFFACTIVGGMLYTLPKCKLISIYPLIVSLIYSTLQFKRGTFVANYIYWLVCAFVFIYYQPSLYRKKAIKALFRQAAYFVIIFVVFSLFILSVRYYYYNPQHYYFLFNSFYFYIAGNLWLLDKYLLTDPQPLYGVSLFRSIISWFAAFGLAEKSSMMYPHYEFYPIYNTVMNTFSYVRVLYEDFNLVGLMLISYIWGFFSYVGIKAYINKFTFVRIGLVAIITFTLFFSFYGFNWIYLTSYIWRLFQLALLDFYMTRLTPLK